MAKEHEYLAEILNIEEQTLVDLEEKLSRLTGKSGRFKNLMEDNEARVATALELLGLNEGSSSEEIYGTLLGRVAENDEAVRAHLNYPDPSTTAGVRKIIKLAKEISGVPRGFFLKHEKAEELLRMNPPEHLLRALGENSIEALLIEYSLEEVFPAIRFAEKGEWLKTVFFKPFEELTPDDFEERDVVVVTIPDKFREISGHFAEKKMHHISHLKELGVIFVTPVEKGDATREPTGSTLEILTLVQHYLHEVPFYSRIFQRFAKEYADSFSEHVVAALRGDVLDEAPEGGTGERFLLIQRYLAKVDKKDPRLLQPHVNPEALQWLLVEEKLEAYMTEHKEIGFTFWTDSGFLSSDMVFVAKPFMSTDGSRTDIISFDFIDCMFSLNNHRKVDDVLLYHTRETVWNELFYRYVGRHKIDQMLEDDLEQGYIEIVQRIADGE